MKTPSKLETTYANFQSEYEMNWEETKDLLIDFQSFLKVFFEAPKEEQLAFCKKHKKDFTALIVFSGSFLKGDKISDILRFIREVGE